MPDSHSIFELLYLLNLWPWLPEEQESDEPSRGVARFVPIGLFFAVVVMLFVAVVMFVW